MSELNDKKRSKDNKPSKRVKMGDAGGGADWGSVDAALLVDAIQQVTKAGGAVRFSYTRDGGAYCIGILGDGEPYNDYIKPSDDIDAYLRGLAENWRV